MDMIGRIRRMSQREGLSERQIANRTGLSRNTVAKWLRAPLKEEPLRRRKMRDTRYRTLPMRQFLCTPRNISPTDLSRFQAIKYRAALWLGSSDCKNKSCFP